jgi:LasA protease
VKRGLVLVLAIAGLLPVLVCNMPAARVAAPDANAAVEGTLGAMRATSAAGTVVAPAVATEKATAVTPATPTLDLPTFTPLPPLPIVTVNAPTSAPTLDEHTFQYVTQPGDTLVGLAGRFSIDPEQIPNPQNAMPQAFLHAGQTLAIPNTLNSIPEAGMLMPDSEIVYSPAAVDFKVAEFVQRAGGFLNTYSGPAENETLTGAQIIQRVAEETSINPRVLLAVLEYRSHWVYGQPTDPKNTAYPIGFYASDFSGLYKEITLVARQLTIGYYGWRTGQVTDLTFADGTHQRIHPAVNAGTAALQYLFSKLYSPADWRTELYNPARFIAFYTSAFGDPWQRASAMGPLLPDNLSQPAIELPFPHGQTWTMTGGPHVAWGIGSVWGGLDFAPSNVEPGCTVSAFWATAAAPGSVVRSGHGEVIIDLDGDGQEQTGWSLLYLHMAAKARVAVGNRVKLDDPIGHPSCEGGYATGTHVHIARKYNGEWIGADGPLPFVLSGWQAQASSRQYSGALVKDGQIVTSRMDSVRTSIITR